MASTAASAPAAPATLIQSDGFGRAKPARGEALKLRMLRMVYDREWGRLIRTAEREERELGRPLARLIARDAAALYR